MPFKAHFSNCNVAGSLVVTDAEAALFPEQDFAQQDLMDCSVAILLFVCLPFVVDDWAKMKLQNSKNVNEESKIFVIFIGFCD